MGYIVGLNLEGAGDMADGSNGHSADGMALPPETVKFRIGGMDLDVPEIMFGDAEALRKPLDDIGPTQHWMDYANSVIQVIAHQMREKRPDLTEDAIKKRMSGGEGMGIELRRSMNELLRISGFQMAEPAAVPPETESPGTGTSIASAPNSPSEASAAEIPAS